MKTNKKKINHTPGPWKAHFNVIGAIIPGHIVKADDEAECPIASLWVGGGTKGKPTQIANAHLIAAAPELLGSLIDVLGLALLKYGNLNPDAPIVFDQARAAIAKAEGGK